MEEKEEKGEGRERGGKRTSLCSSSSLYLSVTIQSSRARIMEITSSTCYKTRQGKTFLVRNSHCSEGKYCCLGALMRVNGVLAG